MQCTTRQRPIWWSVAALPLALILAAAAERPASGRYLYAVAHADAHYVYIARHMDGQQMKAGRDYRCIRGTAQAACLVASADSVAVNYRLDREKVRIVRAGQYQELAIIP